MDYLNYLHLDPYGYDIVTDAVNPVVDLAFIKEKYLYLPASSTVNDDIISFIASGVSDFVENETGRTLINKTYKCYLDFFKYGPILIKKSKLQSIVSIQYYVNDALVTLDPSLYYITDEKQYALIVLKQGKQWPVTYDDRKQCIKITFVAGYGPTYSSIPDDLKLAIAQHITRAYNDRGDCPDMTATNEGLKFAMATAMPHMTRLIYAKYKILRTNYKKTFAPVQRGISFF